MVFSSLVSLLFVSCRITFQNANCNSSYKLSIQISCWAQIIYKVYLRAFMDGYVLNDNYFSESCSTMSMGKHIMWLNSLHKLQTTVAMLLVQSVLATVWISLLVWTIFHVLGLFHEEKGLWNAHEIWDSK